MTSPIFYTWFTQKTNDGFKFTVSMNVPSNTQYEDGTYCKTVLLKTGTCSSRAIAKNKAQQWVRWFKNAATQTV